MTAPTVEEILARESERDEAQAALAKEKARADRMFEALCWVTQTVHQAHHQGPIAECQQVCAEARRQAEWVEA